jgi:hypothetical protein
VSSPRKSMYFVKPRSISLAVRTWDLAPGTRRITLTASDVLLPQGVALEYIDPREVEIVVNERPRP